jgi:O-antigen/teichoic acid export membrane protein
MKRYNQLNLALFFIGGMMLIISNPIYDLWLGKGKVNIPFTLSLYGCLYFNIMIFGSKYVHFLNGINALKIQFWASVISPVVFILLALLFIKTLHWGAASLFIASSFANFNALIVAPVQYYQIIYKSKSGIWKK